MGTRILESRVFDPDGLMSGFGGAKRDRTADLLHAMQALSQLSYGPTLYCEPAIIAGFRWMGRGLFPFPTPQQRSLSNKKDPVVWVFVLLDEWRPHGDSNPGRHRERVMS